eukprot:SAG31_NODE_35749_length_320_cov_0.796380_1_plen_22_part_10
MDGHLYAIQILVAGFRRYYRNS